MLNDFRPELGGADAHSFHNSTSTGQAADRQTSPAEQELQDASSRAPLPTSLSDVAKFRPGYSLGHQQRMLAICQHFAAVTGCGDFWLIREADVTAYFCAMHRSGLAVKTMTSNMAALGRMWRASGTRAVDPFFKVTLQLRAEQKSLKRRESERRVERVWQLLNDEGFVALKKSPVVGHRAAYWMVLLPLFTDMTVAELAQLSPSDFAWTSCAGHLIRQPTSRLGMGQLHPVHRVLIQCGFLEFIAERWAAKAAHLFSDSTSKSSSPRTAMRSVSRVWSGAGEAMRAPSWTDFKAARCSEAERVLVAHPQLVERLEARRLGALPSTGEMQLLLYLERALQYDEVDWSHHYADPVRFEG
jgi:hypothetical protein